MLLKNLTFQRTVKNLWLLYCVLIIHSTSVNSQDSLYFTQPFPDLYLIQNETSSYELKDYISASQFYTLNLTFGKDEDKVIYNFGDTDIWQENLINSAAPYLQNPPDKDTSEHIGLFTAWSYNMTKYSERKQYVMEETCQSLCKLYELGINYEVKFQMDQRMLLINETGFIPKFVKNLDESIWIGGFIKSPEDPDATTNTILMEIDKKNFSMKNKYNLTGAINLIDTTNMLDFNYINIKDICEKCFYIYEVFDGIKSSLQSIVNKNIIYFFQIDEKTNAISKKYDFNVQNKFDNVFKGGYIKKVIPNSNGLNIIGSYCEPNGKCYFDRIIFNLTPTNKEWTTFNNKYWIYDGIFNNDMQTNHSLVFLRSKISDLSQYDQNTNTFLQAQYIPETDQHPAAMYTIIINASQSETSLHRYIDVTLSFTRNDDNNQKNREITSFYSIHDPSTKTTNLMVYMKEKINEGFVLKAYRMNTADKAIKHYKGFQSSFNEQIPFGDEYTIAFESQAIVHLYRKTSPILILKGENFNSKDNPIVVSVDVRDSMNSKFKASQNFTLYKQDNFDDYPEILRKTINFEEYTGNNFNGKLLTIPSNQFRTNGKSEFIVNNNNELPQGIDVEIRSSYQLNTNTENRFQIKGVQSVTMHDELSDSVSNNYYLISQDKDVKPNNLLIEKETNWLIYKAVNKVSSDSKDQNDVFGSDLIKLLRCRKLAENYTQDNLDCNYDSYTDIIIQTQDKKNEFQDWQIYKTAKNYRWLYVILKGVYNSDNKQQKVFKALFIDTMPCNSKGQKNAELIQTFTFSETDFPSIYDLQIVVLNGDGRDTPYFQIADLSTVRFYKTSVQKNDTGGFKFIYEENKNLKIDGKSLNNSTFCPQHIESSKNEKSLLLIRSYCEIKNPSSPTTLLLSDLHDIQQLYSEKSDDITSWFAQNNRLIIQPVSSEYLKNLKTCRVYNQIMIFSRNDETKKALLLGLSEKNEFDTQFFDLGNVDLVDVDSFTCLQKADAVIIFGKNSDNKSVGYIYRGGQIFDANNRNAGSIVFGDYDKIQSVYAVSYDWGIIVFVIDKNFNLQSKWLVKVNSYDIVQKQDTQLSKNLGDVNELQIKYTMKDIKNESKNIDGIFNIKLQNSQQETQYKIDKEDNPLLLKNKQLPQEQALEIKGHVFDIKVHSNEPSNPAETTNIFDPRQPDCAQTKKRLRLLNLLYLTKDDLKNYAMSSIYVTENNSHFALLKNISLPDYGSPPTTAQTKIAMLNIDFGKAQPYNQDDPIYTFDLNLYYNCQNIHVSENEIMYFVMALCNNSDSSTINVKVIKKSDRSELQFIEQILRTRYFKMNAKNYFNYSYDDNISGYALFGIVTSQLHRNTNTMVVHNLRIDYNLATKSAEKFTSSFDAHKYTYNDVSTYDIFNCYHNCMMIVHGNQNKGGMPVFKRFCPTLDAKSLHEDFSKEVTFEFPKNKDQYDPEDLWLTKNIACQNIESKDKKSMDGTRATRNFRCVFHTGRNYLSVIDFQHEYSPGFINDTWKPVLQQKIVKIYGNFIPEYYSMHLKNDFLVFASKYSDKLHDSEDTKHEYNLSNIYTILSYKLSDIANTKTTENVYLYDSIPYAFRSEVDKLNGDEIFLHTDITASDINTKNLKTNSYLYVLDNLPHSDRINQMSQDNSNILRSMFKIKRFYTNYEIKVSDKVECSKNLETKNTNMFKNNKDEAKYSLTFNKIYPSTPDLKFNDIFINKNDVAFPWWGWLQIVLAVLILIGVVVLIIFLFKKKKKGKLSQYLDIKADGFIEESLLASGSKDLAESSKDKKNLSDNENL